ncbi:MAG: hypothetical protein U1E36_08860 [Rickettsiales bacterium]
MRPTPRPPGEGPSEPLPTGPVPTPPPPPPAVCKGTGKQTPVTSAGAFQAALNAASAGDTIILKPGNYGRLTINKGGSSGRPIYIAAENAAVNTSAQPQSVARSTISAMSIAAGNVTICGFYFDDSAYKSVDHTKRADNVTYLQNYFATGVHNSMAVEISIDTWEGGTNLVAQSNYFNATRNSNFSQDYAMAIYKYNGVYVRGNVFDGVFNHQISLKQKDHNVLIDGNVFKGCGQVCMHIGQGQDEQAEGDLTGTNATISNNTFIEAYTTHPQSKYRKALVLRNQQNIVVRGNTFQGKWVETITTDFINRGGLIRLLSRALGVWGNRQNTILIEANKFANALLDFSGRGVGRADQITVRGNTGSFRCTVKPFQEASDKIYVWSTIDRNPPTVTGCP